MFTTTYKEGGESAGLAEVIPPLLILLVFYASILLVGNLMATSLLEEKENRVSEMILTTMNPTTMVSGKVVSLCSGHRTSASTRREPGGA